MEKCHNAYLVSLEVGREQPLQQQLCQRCRLLFHCYCEYRAARTCED